MTYFSVPHRTPHTADAWPALHLYNVFPLQVLFERVTFDLDELQEAIRIIDKDVPRTDRDLAYYQ